MSESNKLYRFTCVSAVRECKKHGTIRWSVQMELWLHSTHVVAVSVHFPYLISQLGCSSPYKLCVTPPSHREHDRAETAFITPQASLSGCRAAWQMNRAWNLAIGLSQRGPECGQGTPWGVTLVSEVGFLKSEGFHRKNQELGPEKNLEKQNVSIKWSEHHWEEGKKQEEWPAKWWPTEVD